VPDLDLCTARRDQVVTELQTALEGAVEGSRFILRGSLAAGTADAYSDIDALWLVPGQLFHQAVDDVAAALSGVRPVAAIRMDPDESSEAYALLFVRLAGLPLFWRLDLEIRAMSTVTSPTGPTMSASSRRNEAEWSWAASALANALAAIKAVVRHRFTDASGLLERGFARLGLLYAPTGSWRLDVATLAQATVNADPSLGETAAEVCAVADALLLE
jgi:hypothetical protein